MAKLDVVIEVNGMKYRKVDRKAQAGDIVRVLSKDYDMQCGGFYPVEDGPGVIDDVNDFCQPFNNYPEDFEVYEKVAETSATKYREVKRKAAVGERIRIVAADATAGYYTNGDELTVVGADRWGNGEAVTVNSFNHAILHSEYVVLVPATEVNFNEKRPKADRLKVGEYAKVVSDISSSGSKRPQVKVGEIRKIVQDTGGKYPFKAEQLDGKDYEYFREDALVRATEAEVEAAKKKAEEESARKAEEAKWAAIGRKVNEFKAGDIVSFVKKYGGMRGIGNVENVAAGSAIGVRMNDTTYAGVWFREGDTATLIVPVEQRFDTKEAA